MARVTVSIFKLTKCEWKYKLDLAVNKFQICFDKSSGSEVNRNRRGGSDSIMENSSESYDPPLLNVDDAHATVSLSNSIGIGEDGYYKG